MNKTKSLIFSQYLASTAFSGLRVPPTHLPPETREAMIKSIERAQRRSLKYWLCLLATLGGIALLTVVSLFIFFKRHHFTALFFAGWFASTFAIIFAWGILWLLFGIKPINVAIVAGVWSEHQICPICDYDRRLSSEQCPECGMS